MEESVLSLFIYLLIVFGTVSFMIFLSIILGPKKESEEKGEPFECGIKEVEKHPPRFSVKFYLVGLLFLLFDIEIAFLYPWGIMFKKLGLFGFVEMLLFSLVLLAGFLYVYKKGVFKWE